MTDKLKSIKVRGGKIKVGDTSDAVVEILKPEDRCAEPTVEPDPRMPGSLQVTQHYQVDGLRFDLVMARKKDPGPYLVKKIVLKGEAPASQEGEA